jgi:hypothetical protein
VCNGLWQRPMACSNCWIGWLSSGSAPAGTRCGLP